MKILHFILTLSILLTPLISAKSLLANTVNTPPETDIDEPFCYMRTTDGKTVDLGKLCENKTPPRTSQSCISGSNIAAKVSITNVNYDGKFLSGQIINQGCKLVKNVKVNYEVLDDLGNPIDNGFITTKPVAVEPGKSATFRGEVVAGAKVRATHADGED
ncbi:MAG: hypothetical protein EAZ09_08065 [Oscillatoriales cyanobacterium]|nr:MAG: hypothetical protein EAZ18_01715 [Oscillatoriales cyanobacterium]TAH23304.1 MAG: hypothetical protein EAZ09_08065 [Oscillatoriales cyanobacterium]